MGHYGPHDRAIAQDVASVAQGIIDHPMLLTRGADGNFSSFLAPREGDDGWRHTGVIGFEDGQVFYRGFTLSNSLQIGGGFASKQWHNGSPASFTRLEICVGQSFMAGWAFGTAGCTSSALP